MSDQIDLGAGVLQGLCGRRVGTGVTDHNRDGLERADAGERDMPDLRTVSHNDDLAGPVDHRAVTVRLDIVVGRAPGTDVDTVDTHEHDVKVERGEGGFSRGPRARRSYCARPRR